MQDKDTMQYFRQKSLIFIQERRMHSAICTLLSFVLKCNYSEITLAIDSKGESRTDGRNIVLSLPDFTMDAGFDEHDWHILLKTLAHHEAGHCNYSRFSDIKNIRKWYGEYMHSNFGVSEKAAENIAKEMLNIIEDGRIERIITHVFPGTLLGFRFLNSEIRRLNIMAGESEFHDFMGNILSYSKTGLLGIGVARYSNTPFEQEFSKIRKRIDTAIGGNAELCYQETREILEKVAPYMAQFLEDDNLEQELEAAQAEEYTSDGGQADFAPDSDDLRPSPRVECPGLCADGKVDFSDVSVQMDRYEYAPDAREMEMAKQSLMESALRKPPAPTHSFSEFLQTVIHQRTSEKLDKVKGNVGQLQVLPASMLAKAKLLEREALKIRYQKKRKKKGLKRGSFDTQALWKIPANNMALFKRKGQPYELDCALSLLVDNSGSMGGKTEHGVQKSYIARAVSAILEEGLKNLMPYQMAVFNSIGKVATHTMIKGFEQKSVRGNYSWSSIAEYRPDGMNRESDSIRMAVEQLCKRHERRKILIVLCDGLPSDYESQSVGINDVRKAVLDAKKRGVTVIGCMFGDEVFCSKNLESFQKMYGKQNVMSCSTDNIDKKFNQLIIRLINAS
jgi:Nitric oxide reductase activation protein